MAAIITANTLRQMATTGTPQNRLNSLSDRAATLLKKDKSFNVTIKGKKNYNILERKRSITERPLDRTLEIFFPCNQLFLDKSVKKARLPARLRIFVTCMTANYEYLEIRENDEKLYHWRRIPKRGIALSSNELFYQIYGAKSAECDSGRYRTEFRLLYLADTTTDCLVAAKVRAEADSDSSHSSSLSKSDEDSNKKIK
uniref:Uncharacterized protein n=1 Tax=Romanomermis culicivorax TaxID=13658 RepID=A0A915HFC3_ROMCU